LFLKELPKMFAAVEPLLEDGYQADGDGVEIAADGAHRLHPDFNPNRNWAADENAGDSEQEDEDNDDEEEEEKEHVVISDTEDGASEGSHGSGSELIVRRALAGV
jgi:hypothetical protein